jgi:hypothetical protein
MRGRTHARTQTPTKKACSFLKKRTKKLLFILPQHLGAAELRRETRLEAGTV